MVGLVARVLLVQGSWKITSIVEATQQAEEMMAKLNDVKGHWLTGNGEL